MPHDHSAHEQTEEQLEVQFEQLGLLESKFEDAEAEVIRKAEAIKAPLYKERTEFVAKVPHFWSLVFEQCPPEVENFIQPTDSEVFADCLETFEVSRFEVDAPNGSPRSFSLKFGFAENEWFEDKTLEKKFWYRHTKDWDGLVSEPVKINWKKGKDLTGGLTDAAVKLHEARKNTTDRKKEMALPEYKELAQKIETSADASVSFFGLFAFVSGYRWVTAEESAEAKKKDQEQLAKIAAGEKIEEEEDDEDDEDPQDYQETEVFPGGDEVATIIAEDMWPNALRYYKQHFEEGGEFDDEDLSELDVDMDEEDDDSAEEVDIRALVGKGKKGDEPPSKKQRKA
ncbi:hypothetical protein E8E13_008528 [Curvularia kusanoi]|uniref:Uncharacterized protein n=1 Tax=Curvularia kusanoi TaxID=90978 RepID=A0A9P4TNJ2_CURKU|nr:hypothetical protein E8E13_008528 [Curvularia kusanoi]